MRRWNSLLLAILLIHFALSQTPYDGPEMICNSTAGSNILSGWCSKTNPYSTRPKFLTDFSLDDRIYPFKPVCEGRGEAYDKCEIVTSIKTTVSQDMPVAIAGLKTGEIVGLRLNDFFLFPVEYTKNDQSLLFMDLVDKYLVVVKQNTAAPYTDYSIICYDVSIRYKRWTRSLSYEWDGEIKKMKLFKTELGHYVAVFLTKNRVSYESKLIFHAFRNVVTEMEIYKTTWTLTHGDFNFDVFEQKWDLPTNSGSLKIKPDAKFRTLVVIHNDFIIKIVGYTFDPSKPAQSKPLVLNFDEKEKDSHSETTTFYRSELQISACILFGEVIRRPNPSSNSTLFHPSQNLHLAVVHSHQYATQSLVIKSIPEFRSISSYVTVEDYDINVINAIPDLSSSNIQFSQMLPFRQSPISLLQSRFIDVPEEVSGEPSYDQLTGSLRPDVLCATFKISPLWSSQHNDSSLLECYQQLGSVQDEIQLLTASNNLNQIKTYLDAFFNSYWNIQLYMASKTHVEFFTLTQSFNHSDRFSFVGLVNTIDSLSGKVKDMHVTANGQYVFLSISRLRYELDSTKRSYEICDELKRDPDNKFLKAYQPACKASPPPHNADINQFSLVVSSCTDNVNCPSVHRTIINSEGFPPGKFLLRSNALVDCPIGSYCQGGMRFDCPPGFFCNKQRLVAPIPCSHSANTTCYNVGLTAPEPCPDGAICTTAYSTPVYSPPGYYLESTTHRLHECRLGDYCALGRESTGGNLTNLLCPAKTVCHNSSVLEPVICDANKTIDFCPEGTHERSLCPAGYYCTNLDVRVACRKSQYCPPGSFASQVCPAGFYCPDPSKKIACPQGYYCTQGSTEPRRCNFFFSKCTSESTNDQLTYVGIALLFVLFLSVTLLWLLYLVAYRIYRHQSKMRRKGIESTSFYDSMYGIEPAELARIASPPSILGDNGYGTLIDQDENNFRQDQFTVDLRFEELGLELRTDGTRVLKGVTGEIKHGQLTAVMGMSGAGKSTFVTTLAGRAYYGNRVGKIYVNGKEASLKELNERVGFVPQEEIMLRMMTVEETLYFAARTRLDKNKTRHQVQQIVDNVIKVLRLEDVRHSVIGDEESRGISGGQRKRVNVAIELVADPYVLFLDEPTSGLDSASSKEVCAALQLIAQSGITVITVIHQPRKEIFDMFSHLLLLGQGGRTVYLGPVEESVAYFENLGYKCPDRVNPADFLIDVTAGNISSSQGISSSQLPDVWRRQESQLQQAQYDQQQQVFTTPKQSYIAQFWMCLQRAFIQQLRNILGLFIDNFLLFFSAFSLGVMYVGKVYEGPAPEAISNLCPEELRKICTAPQSDPIAGQQSMINLAIALVASMASLKTFGKEKVVFLRESETGLSTFCYFWAKDLAMLPSIMLAPAVFLSIYYTTISPRAMFVEYYWILLLCYWTSYGLGYIVSILVKPHIAQLAAVVVVFLINIFSGTVVSLPDFDKMIPPLKYFYWGSYLQYSYQGLYVTEIQYFKNIYVIQTSLDYMGFKIERLPMIAGALCAFGIGFRVIAFFLLYGSKPNSYAYRFGNWVTNFKQHATRVKSLFGGKKMDSMNKVMVAKKIEVV